MMKRQEWEAKKNSFNFIFCSFFFLPHNFLKYHHKFLPVWGKTFHLYRNEWENEKKKKYKNFILSCRSLKQTQVLLFGFCRAHRKRTTGTHHKISHAGEIFCVCKIKWIVIRMYDVWLFNNEGETCEQRNYKLWMQKVRAMNWWNFASIWILICIQAGYLNKVKRMKERRI